MEPIIFVCSACGTAQRGTVCNNPACFDNPNVPQATKDYWRAEIARRQTEQAERDRLNRIRGACYSRASHA